MATAAVAVLSAMPSYASYINSFPDPFKVANTPYRLISLSIFRNPQDPTDMPFSDSVFDQAMQHPAPPSLQLISIPLASKTPTGQIGPLKTAEYFPREMELDALQYYLQNVYIYQTSQRSIPTDVMLTALNLANHAINGPAHALALPTFIDADTAKLYCEAVTLGIPRPITAEAYTQDMSIAPTNAAIRNASGSSAADVRGQNEATRLALRTLDCIFAQYPRSSTVLASMTPRLLGGAGHIAPDRLSHYTDSAKLAATHQALETIPWPEASTWSTAQQLFSSLLPHSRPPPGPRGA